MYSKSLFTNNSNSQKSFINPIYENINKPFINNELYFTSEYNEAINKIHKYYTKPFANKYYDDINENYTDYSDLYSTVSNLEINTRNKTIKILLKICLEGLTGTINAFGLNKIAITTNIQNQLLTKKLKLVMVNKNNNYTIETTGSQYNLQKTFTLAPIYCYYIAIFGLPEPIEGFNPDRIKLITNTLIKNNINPYF